MVEFHVELKQTSLLLWQSSAIFNDLVGNIIIFWLAGLVIGAA